jgi:E3 ubiquitin-protein ligase HERC3
VLLDWIFYAGKRTNFCLLPHAQVSQILRLINEVFSSPKLLAVCFGSDQQKCSADDSDMQVETGEDCELQVESIQLNLNEVRRVYSLILSCGHEGVVNSVLYAFLTLTSDLQIHAKVYNANPLFLKLYFIVLSHPTITESHFLQALKPLFEALNSVTEESRELIIHFAQSWAPETFSSFLNTFRQNISVRISQGSIKEARVGVKCLDLLHEAYQRQARLSASIPPSEFNIQEVSDYLTVLEARKREYQLWLRDLGATDTTANLPPRHGVDRRSLESLISFPYVLTPGVKASIIELDANVQMRQGMHQEYEEAVASGSQYMSPYLVLRVRRNQIVADTVNHFVAISPNDYKKPLKVVFDSEEGVDAGGVRKEFYQVSHWLRLPPCPHPRRS